LIEQGCEPHYLDFLVQWVNSARRGDNFLLPTRADDIFACDAHRLDVLEESISTLSKQLAALWKPRGLSYIHTTIKHNWMLEMPDLLNRYWLALKTIRSSMQKRRPAIYDLLKATLVKYVRDATGGRCGWHDAELAQLCSEERRAWSKWRANHYQPPPEGVTAAQSALSAPIKPIEYP
jgi:hypothetical protein